jgi:cell division protein ZapA (FtsZ GTPase activity inhibitor)
MAALNITHELLGYREKKGETEQIGAALSGILKKLDLAMREEAQPLI